LLVLLQEIIITITIIIIITIMYVLPITVARGTFPGTYLLRGATPCHDCNPAAAG